MERNGIAPAHVVAGLIAALIVSLALCYWIGIGGALLATVVGTVAATIVSGVVGKADEEEAQMAHGAEQLEGVLDSSQLGNDTYLGPSPQAMDERGRKVAVIAAIVLALATAGGVQLATRGAGIHFYLGTPLFPTASQQNKTPQKDAETTTPVQTQEETYYYEEPEYYEEPTENTWQEPQQESQPTSPSQSQSQEQVAPQPQPEQPEATQPTGESMGRGERESTQTPTQEETPAPADQTSETTPAAPAATDAGA